MRGKSSRAALFGWVMFDWAAQPFYTLVVTFLFAPYFVTGFMRDPVEAQALWGYATGAAALIAALSAPMLGAMADAGGRRKPWIAAFSLLLVAGMLGLWFAAPGHTDLVLPILLAFGIATIGAELATVFTNAMMPDLVPRARLGTLSGLGWGFGYVGGLVSLAVMAGLVVVNPATGKTLFGLHPLFALDAATRQGDRLVGPFCALWYALFVLPLFLLTPDRRPKLAQARITDGLHELARTAGELRRHGTIAIFLLARMLYADGLGAIFAFGGIYAASVFGWGPSELGLFGIILTLAGVIGAAFGGVLDDRFGSARVITCALLLLIAAALGVLSVDKTHVLFTIPVAAKIPGAPLFSAPGERVYLAFGILIGLVAGPTQSASRTLLARLCPPDKTTEFFGFYAFSGKVTAFAAPLVIGALTAISGSQRIGISASLAFLVAGLALLQRVRSRF